MALGLGAAARSCQQKGNKQAELCHVTVHCFALLLPLPVERHGSRIGVAKSNSAHSQIASLALPQTKVVDDWYQLHTTDNGKDLNSFLAVLGDTVDTHTALMLRHGDAAPRKQFGQQPF